MRHLAGGDAGRRSARACSPLSCLSTCDAISLAGTGRLSSFGVDHWVKVFLFSPYSERMGTSVAASMAAGAQTTFTFRTVLVLHAVALGLFVVRIVCVCAIVCARIPPSLTARAGRYERRTPLVSSCGFAEQTSGCQRAACRFVTAVCGSAMRTQAFWRTLTSPPLFSGVAESPLIILLFGIMPLGLVGHMHARGSIGMGMKVKDG